jgi:Fic family protein
MQNFAFLQSSCAENIIINLRKNAANIHYICRKAKRTMAKYIYQNENWTNFTWKDKQIQAVFGEVRNLQGILLGQLNNLGCLHKEEASLNTLTLDVVKSSEIEGEQLNYEQVRSSIARRLGISLAGMVTSDRDVEGVVEMMLDASRNYMQPITEERLLGWHAALFPSGRSGLYRINTGRYRTGEMQVVSGAMDKEKIHYEAPSPKIVKKEMDLFLAWINEDINMDPVLKAAIAHFWFIIIHPFDDGNGRIARALSDLLLARADKSQERFYSMSSQIMVERKRYYEVLQKVQHSSGDITEWLDWFLHCLKSALGETQNTLQKIFRKAEFWKIHFDTPFNERQRLMLNKLLDGIDGKLKSSKWAKMAKCSPDSALRDIRDLIDRGILIQENQGGRSTSYRMVEF